MFEHPRNFREKLNTQKQITHLLLFMPSTSLEMHRNRFRPGIRPGPHWGSLKRSLRPLAGGEGARCVLPKNPTPSSARRASAIQAMLCRPPTPPKINPSYGLEYMDTDFHSELSVSLWYDILCFCAFYCVCFYCILLCSCLLA